MIIGNGDIAQTLIRNKLDNDLICYFASGVSNSKEKNEKEYDREWELIKNQTPVIHFVYFSSLCIYYADHRYSKHKTEIENFIKGYFESYTIIRLGNIDWGTNPNTIINYFTSQYIRGIKPELKNVYRHIISEDEFIYWVKKIRIGINDIMNIPGEFITVKEIWNRIIKQQEQL